MLLSFLLHVWQEKMYCKISRHKPQTTAWGIQELRWRWGVWRMELCTSWDLVRHKTSFVLVCGQVAWGSSSIGLIVNRRVEGQSFPWWCGGSGSHSRYLTLCYDIHGAELRGSLAYTAWSVRALEPSKHRKFTQKRRNLLTSSAIFPVSNLCTDQPFSYIELCILN